MINSVAVHIIFACNVNLVTLVPADDLAPDGARPSGDTMLNAKLHMFLELSLVIGTYATEDMRCPTNDIYTACMLM